MAHSLLPTLLASLEVFRISLTRPGYEKLLVLFIGWVRTAGRHAVTETLVVTGVAGKRHHEGFHRFFSRGTWSPDSLGLWLFLGIEKLHEPEAPIRVAIDDTLTPKKGQHVFGLGSHIDPVRSTVARKVFCFGHCWVVLAIVLPVPLCRTTFALPILFRLYTNKKACEKKGLVYRKKTELAAELLRVFVGWTGARRVELAVDSGYANETVIKDLPKTVVLFGAMRPDAVLTDAPAAPARHRNGRPRVRGQGLPKPQELANDATQPWLTCEADLYGHSKTVHYKTLVAQWYQACGVRLLRIVVVRVDTGRIRLRVFFCTDNTISIRQLLESYAGRWTIEVSFRNLKQLFGFADSSARTRAAVERTAPLVGLMYSMLIVWFFQHAHATSTALPPVRPWYSHKRGVAFADILRAAQRVLASVEVLDLLKPRKHLHETPPPVAAPSSPHQAPRRTPQARADRRRHQLVA